MSRSYKKHPVCTEKKNCRKAFKRFSNKTIRRIVGNGKEENALTVLPYKRMTNPYTICDYNIYWSFNRYWRYEQSNRRARRKVSEQEAQNDWARAYRRK